MDDTDFTRRPHGCLKRDRRASMAFTLIEMMVVLGMLGILMGVAFSGIGQARSRARVAKANAEVRELMNAWLSYESAHDDWPVAPPGAGQTIKATGDTLVELLGKGEDKVVYLNVQLVNGEFKDPWGNAYEFRVLDKSGSDNTTAEEFGAAITFPNRQRYVRW